MHGKVDLSGISFDRPFLEDVETLNRWGMEKRLDVTKLSFHALGHVLDDYCMLSAGSALGRGCGPLVIADKLLNVSQLEKCRVAIPGRYTTAAFLFRLFLPDCTEIIEMRFDTIMEAVKNGVVDAGVIIHESRFTYKKLGLVSIQDLGQWWEDTTGFPIPLGCIVAKRSLGSKRIKQIDEAVRSSVQWSNSHPLQAIPYIRCHAQEIEQEVMKNHIELYVNDFTVDLGEKGLGAVEHFIRLGKDSGIFPGSASVPVCI